MWRKGGGGANPTPGKKKGKGDGKKLYYILGEHAPGEGPKKIERRRETWTGQGTLIH